ncbi:VirB4 family type IV secretion system protein [Candidatus Chloroploca asiatica]|uniref:VirB4 family type IV secretion system protein n=1 Tax=Candidatus Chloroploca asiatica TaxID=1506545 RepID=UPI0011428AEE|nr:hypothetical protein [Candidatus Chloroploca asiatica]
MTFNRRERTVTTETDLIAPASIDRGAIDHVRSGQSYTRTFAVLALPRMLPPGALVPIMQLPGVQTALVNHPLPRALAKERLTHLAHQLGVALTQGGETGADEVLALHDLRRVLAAITEEQRALHLIGLYLTVAGADGRELHERSRQLRAACTEAQIMIVACDAHHWEGLLTTAPLGHDAVRSLFETDTPTLARLLPASSATLQSGQGVPILYGVRAEGSGAGQVGGAPVVLDRFALPSPHQATIAATGGGKTYQQASALLQRFAHGSCDLCVLDPKDQEYRTLIETGLGGTYLVLSAQAELQLNPLTLPWGEAAVGARLARLQIDLRARRAALVKHLVASEALARGMPLSGAAEAQLEETVLACYAQRGITSDPTTFHADVPDLRTVAQALAARPHDAALDAALTLFTEGSLGRLLHGNRPLPLAIPPSRLRADVGVLGIDLSAFVQGQDQTLQRVLPALIADYVMTVAMRGTGRPMELIIDEAWAVLNTAAGAQTIELLARLGRSLGVAVTVITQQIREFLVRRVGDQVVPNAAGMTFLDNCETILLLRQLRPARAGVQDDDNPILQAATKLGLTPGEITWLSRCRRDADGVTGLLLVGREPIPLRIPRAPAPIHALIPGARTPAAPPPDEEAADAGAVPT